MEELLQEDVHTSDSHTHNGAGVVIPTEEEMPPVAVSFSSNKLHGNWLNYNGKQEDDDVAS